MGRRITRPPSRIKVPRSSACVVRVPGLRGIRSIGVLPTWGKDKLFAERSMPDFPGADRRLQFGWGHVVASECARGKEREADHEEQTCRRKFKNWPMLSVAVPLSWHRVRAFASLPELGCLSIMRHGWSVGGFTSRVIFCLRVMSKTRLDCSAKRRRHPNPTFRDTGENANLLVTRRLGLVVHPRARGRAVRIRRDMEWRGRNCRSRVRSWHSPGGAWMLSPPKYSRPGQGRMKRDSKAGCTA